MLQLKRRIFFFSFSHSVSLWFVPKTAWTAYIPENNYMTNRKQKPVFFHSLMLTEETKKRCWTWQRKMSGESAWKMNKRCCLKEKMKCYRKMRQRKLNEMPTMLFTAQNISWIFISIYLCECVCVQESNERVNRNAMNAKIKTRKTSNKLFRSSWHVQRTIRTTTSACSPSSAVMNSFEVRESSYTIMSSLQIIMNILHSFT